MGRLFFFICGLIAAVSAFTGRPASNAAQPAAAAKSETPETKLQTAGNGYAEMMLTRNSDGHFYADAMVNGATIRFLVDTGASTVALTRADAQKVGLQFNEAEFTSTAQTAGGSIAVKPITLDRVAMGPLEANQVEATIIAVDQGMSLLGQSWLKRIGKVTIEGDQMVLR